MDDNTTRGAIDADLGVSRRNSLSRLQGSTTAARTDLLRVSGEVQRRTTDLLAQSAPETFGQKILDAIVPSPIRAAKRRGEVALVEAQVEAEVSLLKIVRGAQLEQMQAYADGYAAAAELQVTEEIAMRGIETAGQIDHEIDRSGAAFDQALDAAVATAAALQSASARHAAADRIERRIALRAEVEEAAMQGVRDAVRGVRDRDRGQP
jgi:hypothetical protein